MLRLIVIDFGDCNKIKGGENTRKKVRFGMPPGEFGMTPDEFGMKLSEFGMQPGEFGMQLGGFGMQPGEFGTTQLLFISI